jgi:MFS family permease
MSGKIFKVPQLLILGTLISRITMFMSVPFLSIYLTNALNFSVVQAGYIVGINPLTIVIASLFINKITKHIKLNKLLFITPFIWGISLIAFNFTTNFSVLLFLNGVTGFCYAIYEPNTKYLLSITTNKEKRLLTFNLRYAAINIGALIGPLLGMYFNVKHDLNSYVWLGFTYLLLSVANLLVIKDDYSIAKPNSKKFSIHRSSGKSIQPFVILLFGVSFSYFGYSQFNSNISQYFANSGKFVNGVHLYSLTISICQLFVLLFQFIFLRFTKKASPYLVLVISNILLSISIFFATYSYDTIIWMLMVFTYSLGELLLGSHLDYTVDQLAKPEQKTLYFSLTELIKLGSTLGPIIGSYLIRALAYKYAFIALSIITLLGSICILIANYKSKYNSN